MTINLFKSSYIFLFLFFITLSHFSSLADNKKTTDLIIENVSRLKAKKNIELSILYPEGSMKNVEPVAKDFSEKTKIKINLEKINVDDINTKILIDTTRRKTGFDIALPATFGIPELAESRAILDISQFAKRYEKLIKYEKSFYDLGDFYKGKKYGYQTDGDTYLMFYNQEWLEDTNQKERFRNKYHQELNLPKTWEELDRLMEFFYQPEKEKYGGCLFRTPRYMVWEWWIRFHAKGYYPLKDNLKPNISNNAGIKALEELIKASKYQHPSSTTNNLFENWKKYQDETCFANIGWGGTQKFLNKSLLKNKILQDVTPQVSYFNWGWNYVVSNFSKNKEISYLFCLYATIAEPSTLAIKQDGFFDPFREEHYKDVDIQKIYSSRFLDIHKKTMEEAIPDFYIEGQSQYISILQEAISSAHDKLVTPKEALEHASRQWEKLTNKIGRENQIEQWLFLKSQYPKKFQKN